jgi:hypothetical protein
MVIRWAGQLGRSLIPIFTSGCADADVADASLNSQGMHSICCFTDFGHSSADWAMFVNLDTQRAVACICNSNSRRLHIHKSTSWLELDAMAAEKWLQFACRSNADIPMKTFKYFPDQFWQKNEYRCDNLRAQTLIRMMELEGPPVCQPMPERIFAIATLIGLGLLSMEWWVKVIDLIFTLRYFG